MARSAERAPAEEQSDETDDGAERAERRWRGARSDDGAERGARARRGAKRREYIYQFKASADCHDVRHSHNTNSFTLFGSSAEHTLYLPILYPDMLALLT